MPRRYIYTYEDLAEVIFTGITEKELMKVAEYRPDKTWSDLKCASAHGALRGRSYQETQVEMAKEIASVVTMKADSLPRRMCRKLWRF